MKKIFAALLALVLVLMPLHALAAEETILVTVRIQGAQACYYYETLRREAGQSALEVLQSIADADASLAIEGLETGYVTSVKGEAAGAFGGWDGWLYRVNNTEPAVGMDEYILQSGDSLVLYYGDPYGIGMQYPVMDLTKAAEGVITFVSHDITYDDKGNANTTVNPVADATVTWNGETFTTDENGQIVVTPAAEGEKISVAIEKFADNGAPLVLAFAPGATVTVTNAANVPPTGMLSTTAFAACLAALAVAIAGGKKRRA